MECKGSQMSACLRGAVGRHDVVLTWFTTPALSQKMIDDAEGRALFSSCVWSGGGGGGNFGCGLVPPKPWRLNVLRKQPLLLQ